MDESVRGKDVLALRAAIVCVGLSSVFLGVFVLLPSAQERPWGSAAACFVMGAVFAGLGATNWPAARLGRPGRIVAFWGLAALLALEIMIPLNYTGARRHIQGDWTEGKIRSLSEKTLRVLDRVNKPLRITTFFDHRDPVFPTVKDLLDQYQRNNRNVVVDHVDPAREREKADTLQRQLNLSERDMRLSIVFQYEGARKDVPMLDIFYRSPDFDSENADVKEMGFLGEQAFTSALVELTEGRRKEIWFAAGHGEISPDDAGFRDVAGELIRDNYVLRPLRNLAAGVSDNCTVLVILNPDPKTPYNEREQEAIGRFLGTGGKLFVGIGGGAPCGLEPMLSDFGILMGRNIVINYQEGVATKMAVPVFVSGWHEIVRSLNRSVLIVDSMRTVEPMPSQPGMMGAAPRAEAQPLLGTGRSSWAETDIAGVNRGRAAFDAAVDKRGPLTVAVLHEQPDRTPDGERLPPDAPRTRIVAVGAADFLLRVPVEDPNVRFFLNAVNWLAEKETLIAIPPKRFDVRPMDKLGDSGGLVFWTTTVLLPMFVLSFGVVIWFVRRSR